MPSETDLQRLALEVKVNAQGGKKTVGDLRTELGLLEQELADTTKGSEQFRQKLQQIGNVRGELESINQTIDQLDFTKRGESIERATRGVTGGFIAAQSASALWGAENEDLLETLTKVQAAMALSTAIKDIQEAGRGFRALGLTIQKAFATNPLGVILLAITAVAASGTASISDT